MASKKDNYNNSNYSKHISLMSKPAAAAAADRSSKQHRQQHAAAASADDGEYVVETASLSYCEASELLRRAMDEAKSTMQNNNNNFSSPVSSANNNQMTPSRRNGQAASSSSSPFSPGAGVDTLHEAYSTKIEALERQLNEALGQRSGLERALHHAAADSLRAQNDVKLAKKETEQVRRQLIMTEAELHKKMEELAKRPITTESGLPADEELKMRHNVSVLRAEIALLSDLVNRSPDQQMQLLQRKISELTSDSLKAAEASTSREALLSEVHQRLQAAMERVAHAEDKRDAALSRCATLEDDVVGLNRNLEDTTVALKHQTKCAQTFALGLTKQIISHETSARAAVDRDQAIAERELALYGAGLKTRSLLESSERQCALRMHLLRELTTDTTSCYAKDRTATRYITKWMAYCLRKRSHTLRQTQEKLQEAEEQRDHYHTIANEEEARSEEVVQKVKSECAEQISSIKATADERVEQNSLLTRSIHDVVRIEREAMQGYLDLLNEESDNRYELALFCTYRERQLLVTIANQSMLNLRDTLTREAVDRENHLAKALDHCNQENATLRAAASDAMQDAETHTTAVERALNEAKRQRDMQEEEFKKEMAKQLKDFEDRERRLKLDGDRQVAQKKQEAALQEAKLRSQLSDKERQQFDEAARAKQELTEREEARSRAFRDLQAQLAKEANRSPTPQRTTTDENNNIIVMSPDESVMRERNRRRWLVDNIKVVVDSLEECYLDDVSSVMGNGLEPKAITNLRRSLIRRVNHTNRVLEHWQRRESMLLFFIKWMAFAGGRPAQKVRQQASLTIRDLTQKLTRVKDIAQEALREKKKFEGEMNRAEDESMRTRSELEQLQADYDSLRRAHAMKKAEDQQSANRNSPSRRRNEEQADEETRAVLAQARSQIEQLSQLLKKSRESEEKHAKTIEDLSDKLNQETEAASELKQTIVALLVQAEEAGADLSGAKANSEQAAERLFVLENRTHLVKDLTKLLKELEDGKGDSKTTAGVESSLKQLIEQQLTASEKKRFL